jgi:hypothetical protein
VTAPGRRAYPKKDKPEPRPPSVDDIFCNFLRDQCAKAIVRYIKDGIDTRRAVKSLTLPEFHGMAEAATAEWVKQVSKRLTDERLSPAKREEFHTLLLGG